MTAENEMRLVVALETIEDFLVANNTLLIKMVQMQVDTATMARETLQLVRMLALGTAQSGGGH